jgi:hypothetical protein
MGIFFLLLDGLNFKGNKVKAGEMANVMKWNSKHLYFNFHGALYL